MDGICLDHELPGRRSRRRRGRELRGDTVRRRARGQLAQVQGDHPTLVVRHFFYDWDPRSRRHSQIDDIGDRGPTPKDRSEVDLDRSAMSRRASCTRWGVRPRQPEVLPGLQRAGRPINGFMPPIDRSAIGAAAERPPGDRPLRARAGRSADPRGRATEGRVLELLAWQSVVGDHPLGRHQSSLNAHQAHVDSDGIAPCRQSARP